jgi:hypothetical protein
MSFREGCEEWWWDGESKSIYSGLTKGPFPDYHPSGRLSKKDDWLELARNAEECDLVKTQSWGAVPRQEIDLSSVPPLAISTTAVVAPSTVVKEGRRKLFPLDRLKGLNMAVGENLWKEMGFSKSYSPTAALCLALGISSEEIRNTGTAADKVVMHENMEHAETLEHFPFYVTWLTINCFASDNVWVKARGTLVSSQLVDTAGACHHAIEYVSGSEVEVSQGIAKLRKAYTRGKECRNMGAYGIPSEYQT